MHALKVALRDRLSPDSFGGWVLRGLRRHPFAFPVALMRSLVASRRLTGRMFPVRVRIGASQRLRIQCDRGARAQLSGLLKVNPWGGSNLPSSVYCGSGAALRIEGDFEIGPNVHIQVFPDAELHIGGRKDSTASGITADTRIMVEKSMHIGRDAIIAWEVLISDSDWHDVEGAQRNRPVTIGDRVWIAHGVSILKGAQIPSGCIVGAKSIVKGAVDGPNSLLAGTPARVVRTNVRWKR